MKITTIKETAAEFKVSKMQICHLIKKNKLTVDKLSSRIIVIYIDDLYDKAKLATALNRFNRHKNKLLKLKLNSKKS